MRPESQTSKYSFKDLQDQPHERLVLLLTMSGTIHGQPYSYEVPFAVADVADNADTAVVVGYNRAGEQVIQFSPDHAYVVVRREYLDVYTVAESREAARLDLAERARILKDYKRVMETASGDADIQARYPAPPLFTHETLQPEDSPGTPPSGGFDPDAWLKRQLGEEADSEEDN